MGKSSKELKQEAKERYWKRVYDKAPIIECACGCGEKIKSKDRYGRDKRFISGHNGRKYSDPTQYKREWNHRNREKRYNYKREYIRKRRIALVENAGGKCNLCGYMFDGNNECCLDFHHIDPTTKKFNLNKSSLNRQSMKSILEEAKKCVLLCANCHRLTHNVFTANTTGL